MGKSLLFLIILFGLHDLTKINNQMVNKLVLLNAENNCQCMWIIVKCRLISSTVNQTLKTQPKEINEYNFHSSLLKCLWCQAWMCKQPLCLHLTKIINDSVKQLRFCIGLFDWKLPKESKAAVESSSATFFPLGLNGNYYCSQSHIPDKTERRRKYREAETCNTSCCLSNNFNYTVIISMSHTLLCSPIYFICRHTLIDTVHISIYKDI